MGVARGRCGVARAWRRKSAGVTVAEGALACQAAPASTQCRNIPPAPLARAVQRLVGMCSNCRRRNASATRTCWCGARVCARARACAQEVRLRCRAVRAACRRMATTRTDCFRRCGQGLRLCRSRAAWLLVSPVAALNLRMQATKWDRPGTLHHTASKQQYYALECLCGLRRREAAESC